MGLHSECEIQIGLNNAVSHTDYLLNLIKFVLCGDIKTIHDVRTGKKYSIKIEEIKEKNDDETLA